MSNGKPHGGHSFSYSTVLYSTPSDIIKITELISKSSVPTHDY